VYDHLKNLFDTYSLNARVKPVLIIIFPLFSIILIWFPETRDSYNTAFTLIITFGIISLLSNYFATIGRKKEVLLFQKMGGKPTTIVLRHKDNAFDSITKKRYHSFLSSKLSIPFPSIEEENENIMKSDEIYDSAVRYLRNYSRDRSKYPLVFKENINYGFARNLYSSKGYGISITIISLLLSTLMFYLKYVEINDSQIKMHYLTKLDTLLSLCTLFPMIFIWIFIINFEWVKERAFAYARALLEVCEEISS